MRLDFAAALIRLLKIEVERLGSAAILVSEHTDRS